MSENLFTLFLHLLLHEQGNRIGEEEVHAAQQFVLPLGLRHFIPDFLLVLKGNTPVVDGCRSGAIVFGQRYALTRPLLLCVFPLDAVHLVHSNPLTEQLRGNILVGGALLAGVGNELHNLFVGHLLLRAHIRSAREHTKHKNDVSSHVT